MTKMPSYELATFPLHIIWICDCSGSMKAESKIQSLHIAIKEALPAMRQVAEDNANAKVLVRALKFSRGAEWINKDPIPIENFKWIDFDVSMTDRDIGTALSMVAEELKIPPMPKSALPPVLILIADGPPTDNFDIGLEKLLDQPWGSKSVRIPIKIGNYSNDDFLHKFIGNPEMKPLIAKNVEALVKQIKWVEEEIL